MQTPYLVTNTLQYIHLAVLYNVFLEQLNWVSPVWAEYSVSNWICRRQCMNSDRDYKIHSVSVTLYLLCHDCNWKWLVLKPISVPCVSVHIRHSHMFHVLIYITEFKRFFCILLRWKMDNINHIEEGFTVSVLIFKFQLPQWFLNWWRKCIQLGLLGRRIMLDRILCGGKA